MIKAHGNGSPDVFLLEDHCHGDDFFTGYCISGNTERTLRGLCNDVSLNYTQMWKSALIKDEPAITMQAAKKSKVYYDLNAQLVTTYGPILVEEIRELSPNLIIPLGELSFNYLTGLSGIRKFRGSVLPAHPIHGFKENTKILPILGPYPFLNQDVKLTYISRLDISKVDRYSKDEPLPDLQHNLWVARNASSLRAFLDRSYRDDGKLVFDIETFYGIITCISFCFNGKESVCIPFLDPSIDIDNRVLMMLLVSKVLASPIRKVNQNIKFDWKTLERWDFRVNNVAGDTHLKFSCLYPEFPKNLGFQNSIYNDIPYFKDEGKEWDPYRFKKDRVYLYNAKDSLATWQIDDKQEKELDELGVRPIYEQAIKLLPIYKRAENRGLRIDDLERRKLLAKYDSLFAIEVLKFRHIANNDIINPMSSKQMDTFVYSTLGFKRNKATSKTQEDELELLIGQINESEVEHAKIMLRCIINCRKLHKVTELLSLPAYPDGRWRCEFNLGGTENGRTSANQTTDVIFVQKGDKILIKKLGHSFQTIGKHGFTHDGVTLGQELRKIFIPSYGYRFVEIDQSGAEARVDRVLTGNYDMKIFDVPGIHRLTGSWIYNCSPAEIKKHVLVGGVDRYHTAKTTRHAAERNIKEDTLLLLLQQPYVEVKRILSTIHKFQPEIRAVFHRSVRNAIDESRSLVMPNGRRRDFFGRIGEPLYNEAISTYPQAVVADNTKRGILGVSYECPYAEMLTEQHDGVLYEVPIGKEHEVHESFKKHVETPIDFRTGSLKHDYQLVIPVEAESGDNWYEMESLEI